MIQGPPQWLPRDEVLLIFSLFLRCLTFSLSFFSECFAGISIMEESECPEEEYGRYKLESMLKLIYLIQPKLWALSAPLTNAAAQPNCVQLTNIIVREGGALVCTTHQCCSTTQLCTALTNNCEGKLTNAAARPNSAPLTNIIVDLFQIFWTEPVICTVIPGTYVMTVTCVIIT